MKLWAVAVAVVILVLIWLLVVVPIREARRYFIEEGRSRCG